MSELTQVLRHVLPVEDPNVLVGHATGADQQQEYGVVVDAGSSGSRIRVYGWPQRESRLSVPAVAEVYKYKARPGVSAFSDRLDDLQEYVSRLVEEAKQHVPESQHSNTPLYILATAGKYYILYFYSILLYM